MGTTWNRIKHPSKNDIAIVGAIVLAVAGTVTALIGVFAGSSETSVKVDLPTPNVAVNPAQSPSLAPPSPSTQVVRVEIVIEQNPAPVATIKNEGGSNFAGLGTSFIGGAVALAVVAYFERRNPPGSPTGKQVDVPRSS